VRLDDYDVQCETTHPLDGKQVDVADADGNTHKATFHWLDGWLYVSLTRKPKEDDPA
jgi:hypothetical protein